jgi:hypothetical protein
MDTVELRSDTLRLRFDRRTGALVTLQALGTGWEILDRPHLGLSFRLLVPYPSDDPTDVDFARRMGRTHPDAATTPCSENSRRSHRSTWLPMENAPRSSGTA